MEIKSSNGNIPRIIFFFLVFLSPWILCAYAPELIGFLTVWSFLVVFFLIRYAIAIFRTLTLSDAGITIKFAKWKRFTPWDKLEVKYIRLHDDYYSVGHSHYKAAVVFIPKGFVPIRIAPILYCTVLHPFAFSFIHFAEDIHYAYPAVYETSRSNFLSQIGSFAVNIDGLHSAMW